MSEETLNQIYSDFFGNKKNDLDTKCDTITENDIKDIDSLPLTDESKELLKKIISYIERFNKGEESNYIPFNIRLVSKNKDLISKVCNILKSYSSYINSSNYTNFSLYNISDPLDINKIYDEAGVVSITDLDAIGMNDVNFNKKFFHSFKERISDKNITIISGDSNSIKTFLENDSLLSNYFSFSLEEISFDINDVYNEVKSLTTSIDIENYDVKLLDYISKTYPNTTLDFNSYVNDLSRYISFNKSLPLVVEDKNVDDVFKELNELVGLQKVKSTLNDLVNLITLKNKTHDDLKINSVNLHMVFLGNPGTGKTTVARLIANILYDLKYIRQNKLIEVSSKDLVAEYVGQTAVKTMNVVEKALGGILFIDEAYALENKNGNNTYNGECIATFIKAMEDYRDDLVVIFAGYTKEMRDFLDSNSGIVSRIGYTLHFDDYSVSELKEIFTGMVNKAGFILGDGAIDEVEKLIVSHKDDKNFGNARFIRNVFEKSVIKHASNVKNNKNKNILKTITSKDISL